MRRLFDRARTAADELPATVDGRIIEFASSPSQLSRDNAELVGDTLLVKAPNS